MALVTKKDLKAIVDWHNHNPILEALQARRTPDEATCPVCVGTLRIPIPEASRKWVDILGGYDVTTDTLPCNNCGAQHMFGVSMGKVFTRNVTSEACVHEYTGTKIGNCLYQYDCIHCPETYVIDSGG